MAEDTDDPRVTGDHVRRLHGDRDPGDLTLVGVVHDHPASTYRVGSILDAADPDTLALELPPLAVPLYERYAAGDRFPPAVGGEMSAAVRAAATDRVVGIDGPSARFLGRLLRSLSGEAASPAAAWSELRALSAVTRRALVCRVAGALGDGADRRLDADRSTDHDCAWTDAPATQAAHERSQIRGARTVRDAFGRSPAATRREDVRNDHMADRLAALRHDGDVVAVVGIAHLDPLVDRLRERAD